MHNKKLSIKLNIYDICIVFANVVLLALFADSNLGDILKIMR